MWTSSQTSAVMSEVQMLLIYRDRLERSLIEKELALILSSADPIESSLGFVDLTEQDFNVSFYVSITVWCVHTRWDKQLDD